MEISLKSAYDFKGLKDIYNICNDYLLQSALEKGIAGPADFTPGQWQNRLKDLQRIVFNRSILQSNTEWIDRQKVVSIYFEIYKPLCNEYTQIIKLEDFSIMLGITRQTIYKWNDISYIPNIDTYINSNDIDIYNRNDRIVKDIGEKATPVNVNLCEQIKVDNESCLTDRMIIDKSNPLRYIAILNTKHGWNQSEKIQAQEKPLTLAEIRQSIGLLSAGDGQNPEKSDKPHKIQQNKRKVSEK